MKYALAVAAAAATIGTALPAQSPQRAQPQQAQRAQPQPAQRPQPQAAQIPTRVSAAMLTRLCGEDRTPCLTYIIGAADAYSSALVASGRPQAFCIPQGTTNDQVAQTIVAFLRSRPQEGQSNAALVVLAGLVASYRCGY